jgi:hypothetical protein
VGADPVDRGKPGSKLHLVCDGGGLPLTAVVTAANVADTTMFQAESSTRLGRHRWRVERSLSWLSCWRRLQVRWDRDSGRFFAFVLGQLRQGDRIVVGRDGGAAVAFAVERVERVERVAKESLPVGRIWNRTSQPVLRLITCGGSFDRSTGHYRDNVIVYAKPAS